MIQNTSKNIHRFTHGAMGTVYETKIYHPDFAYAKAASIEAFRLLDILEGYLSHYIANSDISRISNLQVGESTRVSFETFECLMQCVEMYGLTGGVFDVTIGTLYNVWLNEDKSLRDPSPAEIAQARAHIGLHHLSFDETDFRVRMDGGPVRLDLGGFGKGYALDKMAELFQEWEITSYALNAGQSTLRFGDAPDDESGWYITLSDPFNEYTRFRELYLHHQAISSSGLQKGRHIIDPRTAQPIEDGRATWAFAPRAAFADGLSTAFMILSREDIEKICTTYPQYKALLLTEGDVAIDQRLQYIGEW